MLIDVCSGFFVPKSCKIVDCPGQGEQILKLTGNLKLINSHIVI